MQSDKPRFAARDAFEPLTLEALGARERARIVGIDAEEALYHRLAALGLRIGKEIELLRRAPFGGPLQLRVGMTEVMLRPREAQCVRVAPEALA